jgi:uncharacterized protein
MNKTIVIYHSADYDGIFCREIARRFVPDAELVGWDFADPAIGVPFSPGDPPKLYILDLPCDRPFGFDFGKLPPKGDAAEMFKNVVWIDHHKSSIDSHPAGIPGYRIDGVAACRLAWQWFTHETANKVMSDAAYLPTKDDYLARRVTEPLAVRLAGEYDIWDHRGDGDLEFQFGLRAYGDTLDWDMLFEDDNYTHKVVGDGTLVMDYSRHVDESTVKTKSFIVEWEGLKFLALNSARFNSLTFNALDVPETGHDALLGFCFTGKKYTVSLYHAKHRTDLDLSVIAVKHGGGGHRGACGFTADKLPFLGQ